jgi:hypothetical protein
MIDREFATYIVHTATDERVRDLLRVTAHELNNLLPECSRKTEAIDHLRLAMWAAVSAVTCYGTHQPTWVESATDAAARHVEQAYGLPAGSLVVDKTPVCPADPADRAMESLERASSSLGALVADEAQARQVGKP